MFQIKNANHTDVADYPVILNTDINSGKPVNAGLRRAEILTIYLLSFFNKYLIGHDDHVLEGPLLDYSEIQNYLKK